MAKLVEVLKDPADVSGDGLNKLIEDGLKEVGSVYKKITEEHAELNKLNIKLEESDEQELMAALDDAPKALLEIADKAAQAKLNNDTVKQEKLIKAAVSVAATLNHYDDVLWLTLDEELGKVQDKEEQEEEQKLSAVFEGAITDEFVNLLSDSYVEGLLNQLDPAVNKQLSLFFEAGVSAFDAADKAGANKYFLQAKNRVKDLQVAQEQITDPEDTKEYLRLNSVLAALSNVLDPQCRYPAETKQEVRLVASLDTKGLKELLSDDYVKELLNVLTPVDKMQLRQWFGTGTYALKNGNTSSANSAFKSAKNEIERLRKKAKNLAEDANCLRVNSALAALSSILEPFVTTSKPKAESPRIKKLEDEQKKQKELVAILRAEFENIKKTVDPDEQ